MAEDAEGTVRADACSPVALVCGFAVLPSPSASILIGTQRFLLDELDRRGVRSARVDLTLDKLSLGIAGTVRKTGHDRNDRQKLIPNKAQPACPC